MTSPASPESLVEALRRPSGGMHEVRALVAYGAAAVPLLIEAARDAEARVRGLACFGLGQLGASTPPVVRALRLRLDDGSHEVRAVAARALAALRATSDDILQRLALLRQADPSPATRSAAEEALLVLLGTTAGPARPVAQLLRDAEDADPEARDAALASLGRLDAAALDEAQQAAIEAAVIARLRADGHHPVRMSAALALWKLGRATAPAIDALIRALGDPHPMVGIMAAQVLGNFGTRAAPAMAALEAAAADLTNPALAQLARQSAQRIRNGAS